MLVPIRPAAMTGRTISAAMSRMPTIRIETATVTPASAASATFRSPIGSPLTRAPSSSSATATSPR